MPFNISLAQPSHLPGICTVWFSAFCSPGIQNVFPRIEPVDAWISDSIARGFHGPELNISYVIITEDLEGAEPGTGKVVAFARWVKHPGGDFEGWQSRWRKDLAEGMDKEKVERQFFGTMAIQHEKTMGQRPHYFLEVLATHEDYRKKGLGSMLLHWGAEAADQERWESYLDATKSAMGLYTKFDFVEQDQQGSGSVSIPMLRAWKANKE